MYIEAITDHLLTLTLHLQFEMVPSNEVRSPCKLCSQWEQPGHSEQSLDIDSDRQDNSAFTLNIFLPANARTCGFEEKHIFIIIPHPQHSCEGLAMSHEIVTQQPVLKSW